MKVKLKYSIALHLHMIYGINICWQCKCRLRLLTNLYELILSEEQKYKPLKNHEKSLIQQN